MNALIIVGITVVLFLAIVLLVVGLVSKNKEAPLSSRLGEFTEKEENKTASRLPGDSTTDAPPPEKKKRKNK
jgi:hypothetical protein